MEHYKRRTRNSLPVIPESKMSADNPNNIVGKHGLVFLFVPWCKMFAIPGFGGRFVTRTSAEKRMARLDQQLGDVE